jgi:molybdenum cofactor cytidylyltransferase
MTSTQEAIGTGPIAGLLLAAGSGVRFGGRKLLAPLPAASHGVAAGTPIGVAACFHLAAALPRVVAVVRRRDAALREHLLATGADVMECDRAHEGMGATLAFAVAATADAAGWIVALADMPWIAPATIEHVAARLRAGASIVAPMHAGQRGHPVGFAAPWYGALAALGGDEGARSVIARYAAAVQTFEVDDPGVLRDVDRREDLTR